MSNLQSDKKYFIGVDISKSSFDATMIDQKHNKIFYRNFSMNLEGFTDFIDLIKNIKKEEIQITVESTGIYFFNLYNYLIFRDFDIAVVNPLLIHNFHKGLSLRKTKTDKKDSYIIALFTLKNIDILRNNKKQTSTMKRLCRERDKLSEEISKLKTEIKSELCVQFPELENHVNVFTKTMLTLLIKASSANGIAKLSTSQITTIFNKTSGNKVQISAKELRLLAKNSIGTGDDNLHFVMKTLIIRLRTIQDLISKLDKRIEKFVDDNWNAESEILTSIKGVGKITSQKFLIEVENIFNFKSHKQLTAYAGTDPSIKQSGSSILYQGRISKRGNKYLRKTLYQMAESCIRNSCIFNAYFHKKRDEKKKYKQAVIAVANKLLRTIFALLTKRKMYIEV